MNIDPSDDPWTSDNHNFFWSHLKEAVKSSYNHSWLLLYTYNKEQDKISWSRPSNVIHGGSLQILRR